MRIQRVHDSVAAYCCVKSLEKDYFNFSLGFFKKSQQKTLF
jgi:hypothetical protein